MSSVREEEEKPQLRQSKSRFKKPDMASMPKGNAFDNFVILESSTPQVV
jgi:hypothetical protein